METSMGEAISLRENLTTFTDFWGPPTIATFNGHDVMVVRVLGEFVWHTHDESDDFFLFVSGRLTIQLRDGEVSLGPGDIYIVPRGVEHRPVAEIETHLLLIEPIGTPNTGDLPTAAPHRSA